MKKFFLIGFLLGVGGTEAAVGEMDFAEVQRRIGYQFKNPQYLRDALTQRDNEPFNKLEILGDSILGAVVTSHFITLPSAEAIHEKRRTYTENTRLSQTYKDLGLASHLRHSVVQEGGRETIYANAMEALIGAVFQDGEFGGAKRFIDRIFFEAALPTAAGLRVASSYSYSSPLLPVPSLVSHTAIGGQSKREVLHNLFMGRRIKSPMFKINKSTAELYVDGQLEGSIPFDKKGKKQLKEQLASMYLQRHPQGYLLPVSVSSSQKSPTGTRGKLRTLLERHNQIQTYAYKKDSLALTLRGQIYTFSGGSKNILAERAIAKMAELGMS